MADNNTKKHQNVLIKHVGIIMDGNGRWAVDRGLSRSAGHIQGAKVVKEVISAATELSLETLTLYAFSTENWNRPKYEVAVLMRLFKSELLKQAAELIMRNIQVRFIGSRTRLPKALINTMSELEAATTNNKGLTLQLAINYGGRQDLLEAFQKIAADNHAMKRSPQDISLSHISDALSTGGVADPDLIIRTSGELRLSNFLLWQAAYSEFAFTEKHWPSFTKEDLAQIIKQVSTRERRFGAIIS